MIQMFKNNFTSICVIASVKFGASADLMQRRKKTLDADETKNKTKSPRLLDLEKEDESDTHSQITSIQVHLLLQLGEQLVVERLQLERKQKENKQLNEMLMIVIPVTESLMGGACGDGGQTTKRGHLLNVS